ncbi:MAG: PD-(D/E)XK nuclease family protein, partial [Acidimicrobiia bacterium]
SGTWDDGSSTLAPVSVDFPEVMDGDDIRISASTFVSYKRCPGQAGARLQGIYGPDSRPAFLGSLAHRIFSRHLTGGPISSEEFVQACREEIGGSSLNNKLGPLEMRPSALAAAIEEVRGLYERFTRLPNEGFEGSERELEATPARGVALVGTIDAVYREDLGGHRLVDWKTGELGDPEDQLSFYALLWALEMDEIPAYVEAVSVRTGERYRATPSADDLDRVAAEVGSMVSEIRRSWSIPSDLDRTGGPWCRYCPILTDCAEGQSAEALLDRATPRT